MCTGQLHVSLAGCTGGFRNGLREPEVQCRFRRCAVAVPPMQHVRAALLGAQAASVPAA